MSERSNFLKFELQDGNLCNLIYFCDHGFDKSNVPILWIFDMHVPYVHS